MRFIKSAGVGLLAAVATTILAVVVQVFVGYAYVWVQMSEGSGGMGAYESGLVLPLLAGFGGGIAGFVWQWRRRRRVAP